MRTSSAPVRVWRIRPWARSALLRTSDRIEGLVWLLAAILVIAAVPVSAAFGTAAYTDAVTTIRAETATKTSVSATLTANPTVTMTSGPYDQVSTRYQAPVQWNIAGRPEQGTTDVSRDAERGRTVHVWVGADGRLVAPPPGPDAAAFRGIGDAMTLLVGFWMGVVVLLWLIHWTFGLRRDAGWAREWQNIDRPIGQDR